MRAHLDPDGGVSLTNDPADPGSLRPLARVSPGRACDRCRSRRRDHDELHHQPTRRPHDVAGRRWRRDAGRVAVPGRLPRPAGDVRSPWRPRCRRSIVVDSADAPRSMRWPMACRSRSWSRCSFGTTATSSGHPTTPAGTPATWSPTTASEPERSTDRAQQWAVEWWMPRRDVARVGHGHAIDFHPGVSQRPACRGRLRRRLGSTGRRPHNDRISQISCDRAMHVVLRRRISSRDAVDGAPDPARATARSGETEDAPSGRRLPTCAGWRGGCRDAGRAASAERQRQRAPIPGEMRRSAASTSARATTTLTVQRAQPADVGVSAAAGRADLA